MLDWQKEQVEQLKKLPDFDNVSVIKNYDSVMMKKNLKIQITVNGDDSDDQNDDDG